VAKKPPDTPRRKPRYTADEGAAGAFEGETVTRRRFMTGSAMAVGGVATSAFLLPALGFALGPQFEDTTPDRWQDVGPVGDFNDQTYVPKVMNIVADAGEAGKSTVYIRKFNAKRDDKRNDDLPYVAISTRCAHLGCPVRYIQASKRFVCPCHGGVYDFEGKVEGGPPVRPLDRFFTRVTEGRVEVGERFSVNSELRRFSVRDPSNHLDGLWQYLYPSRPST
jgi:menaquinol-cytochrome c reductase iron-sulfur subunit